MLNRTIAVLSVVILLVISSCDRDRDPRAVQLAREAADRQARQNEQMAKLQEHVAKGTNELVANSTAAHKELTELQRELRKDQATVGELRDALEVERKEIAATRNRDPIIAQTLLIVGLAIVCLVPLALAAYALRVVETARDDSLVASTLIEDLASTNPAICIGTIQPSRAALPDVSANSGPPAE